MIRRIVGAVESFRHEIKIAYLEDYDMELGRQMVSGVDLWLNTPHAPLEASGTSGMKAALNGVPSLSVRDGWWVEGHIEGLTGWAIGEDGGANGGDDAGKDARSLYGKLEFAILPLFYGERDRWLDVMRHAMALNASFFNTQRMLQQYVLRAYF
jgi:starch phosphorylase